MRLGPPRVILNLMIGNLFELSVYQSKFMEKPKFREPFLHGTYCTPSVQESTTFLFSLTFQEEIPPCFSGEANLRHFSGIV
jgi:hypothetical protein